MKIHLYLILIITILSVNSKTLEELRDKYCSAEESSESVEQLNLDPSDISGLRSSRDNIFYGKYKDIIEYIRDNKSSKIITATLPWFLLLIFFLIILIILVFCLMLFLNGKFEREGEKPGSCKGLTLLLYFILFVFFLAIIAFLALQWTKRRKVDCIFWRSGYLLIDGENTRLNSSFLGFKTLRQINEDFKSEINNLSTLDTIAQDILNENLATKTGQLFDHLENFTSLMSTKKTRNPASGLNETPISVYSMDKNISPAIF